MNQVNQTVLALLRGAVWGEKITLSAEADWQAVTREMQAQTVLSMVAGADLPEEIPETVRFQWQRAALYQGAQFYRLLHAQDEMVELLEGHGFHPAILKGMAAAIYYPAPETRTMGDIDFILPREELEAGFSLLRENGYVLEAEEDVNNKHILLAKSEAHFELHRYFGKFDSVEKMQRMDELVQDGLHHLDHSPCAGSSTPVLPALVNGIILLEHAAGHMQGGIGLRHVMDWMMYVRRHLTDAFWQETFLPAIQPLGLEHFACLLTSVCQNYLGLPEEFHWCQAVEREKCDQLLEYILFQGNFGRKEKNVGDKITLILSERKGIAGWLRLLQGSGMKHWKAAKQHACLRPFAWIYGGCRYAWLALGRKKAFSKLLAEKQASEERNVFLQEVGVGRREKPVLWLQDRFVERKS